MKSRRLRLDEVATQLAWLRFFRERAPEYLGVEADRIVEWLRAEFEKEMKTRCPENL